MSKTKDIWTVRVDSDGPSIVSESGDWICVETRHGAEVLASKLNRLEKLEKAAEALKNLMDLYDTPIERRRQEGNTFYPDAIASARSAIDKAERHNDQS